MMYEQGEGRNMKDEGRRMKGEGPRAKGQGPRMKDEERKTNDEGQKADHASSFVLWPVPFVYVELGGVDVPSS